MLMGFGRLFYFVLIYVHKEEPDNLFFLVACDFTLKSKIYSGRLSQRYARRKSCKMYLPVVLMCSNIFYTYDDFYTFIVVSTIF